jgi:hypothetical protein
MINEYYAGNDMKRSGRGLFIHRYYRGICLEERRESYIRTVSLHAEVWNRDLQNMTPTFAPVLCINSSGKVNSILGYTPTQLFSTFYFVYRIPVLQVQVSCFKIYHANNNEFFVYLIKCRSTLWKCFLKFCGINDIYFLRWIVLEKNACFLFSFKVWDMLHF